MPYWTGFRTVTTRSLIGVEDAGDVVGGGEGGGGKEDGEQRERKGERERESVW